jgi:hypothetical protein
MTEKDKKKRKEEGKSRTTPPERPLTEVKAETRAEEAPEKKKEKPKSLRTTAPSHAKFRSTGKAVGWAWRAAGTCTARASCRSSLICNIKFLCGRKANGEARVGSGGFIQG